MQKMFHQDLPGRVIEVPEHQDHIWRKLGWRSSPPRPQKAQTRKGTSNRRRRAVKEDD